MSFIKKRLTTADVPSQFLHATLLTGKVPHRILRSEPRVCYALYIPPNHYNPGPWGTAQDEGLTPRKLPLLVAVHGTRRKLSEVYDDLIPFAESAPCAVLAPLFPAGIDGPNDLDSYKLLRSPSLRSDLALLSMLDEIAECWHGIETEKIFMMGFSGGGQFVHRFLYLYPERVAAASVGAPGRVTALDERQEWPVGVGNVENMFGRKIRKDLLRQAHIQLIVGSEDNEIHGGDEFWAWLQGVKAKYRAEEAVGDAGSGRKMELPTMQQGRLKTLEDLHAAWKQDGIDAQFDVVEGIAHDVRGAGQKRIQQFLLPHMRG